MDATALTSVDPAQLVGLAVSLVGKLGLPWWVPVLIVGGAVVFFGLRALPGLRVERAPDPISDGGTAADRTLPAARPGAGGPRAASDGSAAGDEALPPAAAAPATDQDDPWRGAG